MSTEALFYLEWGVRLAMFLVIILRKRAPTVALAWLAVVAFLPFVGTVLYLMLGETRLGRRRSLEYQEFDDVLLRSPRLQEQLREVYQPQLAEPHRTLSILAERLGGSPPRSGNAIELLASAREVLERQAADIDAAQHHCHLMYYIVNDDEGTRAVVDALVRAAQRGVACRFLADASGARPFLRGPQAQRLRKAGVEVVAMLPVNALRAAVARLDLRNHRKLMVVDGLVGYTGSHNLTLPSYPGKERFGGWVDASIRVRGPLVHELQELFLHDWAFARGDVGPEERFFPPYEAVEGGVAAALLPTGPGVPSEAPLVDVITQTLRMAQRRCVLTTPYFVPDEEILASMRSAALRGVEVVLVTPRHSDQWLAQSAGRSNYGYLLEVGVEIREYEGGLLHAKTLTMDYEFAMTGSANLDIRSFSLNFEVAVLLYDTDIASQMHFLQMGYIEQSRPLTLNAWRKRGPGVVLADNVAKLITPLL